MSTISNKICRLCGLEKPTDDFYFRKDRNKCSTNCKSCTSTKTLENYKDNKVKRLEQMRQYRKLNRVDLLNKSREHYTLNRETILERSLKWREEFRIVNGTSYNNFRYHEDLNFKLKCVIRNRLADALKADNLSLVHVDVGCSTEFLIVHLESQFQSGMSWDNWSREGWHIDHIIPLENFDLSDPEQFKKACHYTNLQPLWAKDNWYKNRVVD